MDKMGLQDEIQTIQDTVEKIRSQIDMLGRQVGNVLKRIDSYRREAMDRDLQSFTDTVTSRYGPLMTHASAVKYENGRIVCWRHLMVPEWVACLREVGAELGVKAFNLPPPQSWQDKVESLLEPGEILE